MDKLILAAGLSGLVAITATGLPSTPNHRAVLEALSAQIAFEQNTTDGDAEVVLEIDAEVAIDQLTVTGPAGDVVLQLMSTDGQRLGLAEVVVESAEPDIESVKLAYPAGSYQVKARSVESQEWLRADIELTHDLPATPRLTAPAGGQPVPVHGAVVRWQADAETEGWSLELKQDELELALTVQVPGSVTSFTIPDSFLVSGEVFDLSLVAIAGGNRNGVELEFPVQ